MVPIEKQIKVINSARKRFDPIREPNQIEALNSAAHMIGAVGLIFGGTFRADFQKYFQEAFINVDDRREASDVLIDFLKERGLDISNIK